MMKVDDSDGQELSSRSDEKAGKPEIEEIEKVFRRFPLPFRLYQQDGTLVFGSDLDHIPKIEVPEQLSSWKTAFAAACNGAVSQITIHYAHTAFFWGRWFEHLLFPVEGVDQSPSLVGEFIREATTEKTTGHRLAESEELYRTLTEALPEGVTVSDTGGKVTFVSGQQVRLLGYDSKEDILGRNLLEFIDPGNRAKAIENIRMIYEGARKQPSHYFIRKANGNMFIGEVSSSVLRDRNGQIKGMISITRDVTKRVKMEEELTQTREEALQAWRNAEIANRAKDTFLASMSHEIRTPMNSIIGFTELLMDDETDDEKLEKLQMVHRSGQYLLQILNDILDISRIEAGKLRVDNREFNLGRLINEVRNMIFLKAEEKGLTCKSK